MAADVRLPIEKKAPTIVSMPARIPTSVWTVESGWRGPAANPGVGGVAAVALHLVPDDVVPPRFGEETLPEITVGDRLLAGAQPAAGLPARPPAIAEAVHDVRGIGEEVHGAAARDGGEAFDGRPQLHPLIRGVRLGAAHDPFGAVLDEEGGPAARPRIARAGAVRVEGDLGHSCQ